MKRKRILILLAFVLLIAAVFGLWTRSNAEASQPHYQGQPLIYWINQLRGSSIVQVIAKADGKSASGTNASKAFFQPTRVREAVIEEAQAHEAILQIGTNALPCLLKWIQYKSLAEKWPSMRTVFDAIPDNCFTRPFLKFCLPNYADYDWRQCAITGFHVLGEIASPAIPELERLAGISTGRYAPNQAGEALGCIGLKSLPALTRLITNNAAGDQYFVMMAVAEMGTNALPALPALIKCLESQNPFNACRAADTLGKLALAPDIVLPALTNAFQSTIIGPKVAAICAVSKYGSAAVVAIPHLEHMQLDTNTNVANAAIKALKMITNVQSSGH